MGASSTKPAGSGTKHLGCIRRKDKTLCENKNIYPDFCEWKGTYCHSPAVEDGYDGRSADTLGEGLLETINQDRWDKDE